MTIQEEIINHFEDLYLQRRTAGHNHECAMRTCYFAIAEWAITQSGGVYSTYSKLFTDTVLALEEKIYVAKKKPNGGVVV